MGDSQHIGELGAALERGYPFQCYDELVYGLVRNANVDPFIAREGEEPSQGMISEPGDDAEHVLDRLCLDSGDAAGHQ